ncbi:MAG TPA: sigma-70 family RNA polymerase sigma factor [Anaerohalosphaeraceae bacterium]|nr:sigma-70 family RNA polymerase sigma factor [Anaerohalosphaeraceae bacterium]HOL88703.1 sigma-70 family RNA polymerase sigma factor [Anaerohalosphaeraceae bacterium]HPP56564.1 sigma-70 family RNA polymerase sigma factor [Anaerohalosphaeraceae bacterium]
MDVKDNPEYQNQTLEEEVLIKRSQRGDLEAAGLLIVRYQDRLYNTILKICSNPEDAAELTQETFVKVLEKITDFRGKSSFYTWLFRIGVNLTLNFCKRRGRLVMQSIDGSGGDESERATARLSGYLLCREKADPVGLAQDKEAREIVLRALGRLDEEQRVVLVLRDIEGLSYQEIAEILDIELGTVKSRISRARAGLRDMLEAVLA